MAATVYLSETNGAGAVTTDNISNCNFGGVDLVNLVPANHPIVRTNTTPTRVNSFIKYWRVKVDAMGGSLLIQDMRFWKDSGALKTGEFIYQENNGFGGYNTPTQGNIGANNIPTADPGSANIYISGSLLGTIAAAPAYSDYVRMQTVINVGGLTPIGSLNQKVFIFSYSES